MENHLVVSLILVWTFCLQRSYSAESALQFKLSSGEEISCVPMYEQPSLKWVDHESNTYVKTHVIPEEIEIRPAEEVFKSEVGSCPEGMISILRNQRPMRRIRGISPQGVDSIHGSYGHKSTVTSTNTSEADPANELNLSSSSPHEVCVRALSEV
ncbi:hypothetical protein R1sor_026480 [Riccia sorocarpa]|uniref:Uncharacterized protein n=1 Tax=Riccia sorocarpa TaxID=122646 RepID=A0ABD3GBI2_9MARC